VSKSCHIERETQQIKPQFKTNIAYPYFEGSGLKSWPIKTEVFHGIPQSLQANSGIIPLNLATTASFQILYNLSFTFHPIIRGYMTLSIEKRRKINCKKYWPILANNTFICGIYEMNRRKS
jgi:hypothetical protein